MITKDYEETIGSKFIGNIYESLINFTEKNKFLMHFESLCKLLKFRNPEND